MATTPFRTSPVLGPGLKDAGPFYWDDINPNISTPSYQPGTKVQGNDGTEYVFVIAHADLAKDAACKIASSGTASAAGTGYKAAAAVKSGEAFHARKDIA